MQKSWAYTFQVNEDPTPTGRPAGQLMWAGLANLFYWIDHKNGFCGFWTPQLFPFQDVASYLGFIEFESAIYRTLKRLGHLGRTEESVLVEFGVGICIKVEKAPLGRRSYLGEASFWVIDPEGNEIAQYYLDHNGQVKRVNNEY